MRRLVVCLTVEYPDGVPIRDLKDHIRDEVNSARGHYPKDVWEHDIYVTRVRHEPISKRKSQ